MDKLNIYQRINAIMNDCEYIQKKQAQQGKGVKYDEVIAMLRDLLISHGVVMVVRQTSMDLIGGVEGTKQKVFQGCYEMDLVNIDKPEEKVTHSTFAHGMDGGDKSPGKAHTYAVKLMLVKGFGIETGEDEESRSEKIEARKTLTEDEQNELASLIDSDQKLWAVICKAYNISHLNQLGQSKLDEVKTRIKKYKAAQNANN